MTDLWTTKVKRCVVKKKKSKMGAWRRKSGRGVEEERGEAEHEDWKSLAFSSSR